MRMRPNMSRIVAGLVAAVALLVVAMPISAAGTDAPKLGIRLLDTSAA